MACGCTNTTYSGFSADSSKNYLLDSFSVFINFDIDNDTYATAKAAGKLLGATQGGASFSAVPEMRTIEVDGVKGAAKGNQVIDSWEVMISPTMLEIDETVIAHALATSTTTEQAFYNKIQANNYICDDDYLANVTLIGRNSGTNKPVIIQIFNAVNTNGISLETADNAEGTIALEFKGHYDAADLDSPPFAIYHPKSEGTISGTIFDGTQAQGTLTIDTQVTVGDTMTVGSKTYTFVTAGNFDTDGEISVGADLTTGQAAIVAAINGTDGVNTANADVTIAAFAANDAILTAITGGTVGNGIVTTETFTAVTNVFDDTTLGATTAGSGAGVEGGTATVTVDGEDLTATSAADGTFTICNVPYGAGYTVNAENAGATKTGSVANVTVIAGQDTAVGTIVIS